MDKEKQPGATLADANGNGLALEKLKESFRAKSPIASVLNMEDYEKLKNGSDEGGIVFSKELIDTYTKGNNDQTYLQEVYDVEAEITEECLELIKKGVEINLEEVVMKHVAILPELEKLCQEKIKETKKNLGIEEPRPEEPRVGEPKKEDPKGNDLVPRSVGAAASADLGSGKENHREPSKFLLASQKNVEEALVAGLAKIKAGEAKDFEIVLVKFAKVKKGSLPVEEKPLLIESIRQANQTLRKAFDEWRINLIKELESKYTWGIAYVNAAGEKIVLSEIDVKRGIVICDFKGNGAIKSTPKIIPVDKFEEFMQDFSIYKKIRKPVTEKRPRGGKPAGSGEPGKPEGGAEADFTPEELEGIEVYRSDQKIILAMIEKMELKEDQGYTPESAEALRKILREAKWNELKKYMLEENAFNDKGRAEKAFDLIKEELDRQPI